MIDPEHHFVEEPRRRLVTDAAAAAIDVELTAARAERAWERIHSEGRATLVGEFGLVLWNFGVGDASLKREHRVAIEQFLSRHRFHLFGGALLHVQGHASSSGQEALNMQLSRQRAETVAGLFMLRGVPGPAVAITAAGERQPTGRGDTGEALARDRRVEVSVVLPAQPPSPEEGEEPPLRPTGPATVGGALRFTIKVGPVPLPLFRRWGTGMLEGELQVMRVDVPGLSTVRVDIQNARAVKVALETWLSERVRLISGERSALGINVFEGYVVDFEFKPTDRDWPFTVAVNVPATDVYRLAPIPVDLPGGIRVRVVGMKIRVAFRPNQELIRRATRIGQQFIGRIAAWVAEVGAAEAAAQTGAILMPIAYVGFIVWGFSRLNEAHAQGSRRALLANMRRGYARLIAHAVMNQPARASDIEAGPGLEEDRAVRQVGGTIGAEGWRELRDEQQDAIRRALAGQNIPTATDTILSAIGQGGDRPIPHPRELVWLLASGSEGRPER